MKQPRCKDTLRFIKETCERFNWEVTEWSYNAEGHYELTLGIGCRIICPSKANKQALMNWRSQTRHRVTSWYESVYV